jgi:hypothetical protein
LNPFDAGNEVDSSFLSPFGYLLQVCQRIHWINISTLLKLKEI